MQETIAFRDRAAAAVGAGLLTGALVGALEHLIFNAAPSWQSAREMAYAAGLYAALGSLAGLALGLLWAGAIRVGLLQGERRPGSAAFGFQIALFVLLVVGFRLNDAPGMPSPTSRSGLLLNGFLLLAALGLGSGLGSLLGRIRGEFLNARWGRGRSGAAVLVAIPVLVLISVVGYTALLGLGSRAGPSTGTRGPSSKPNVILILIDALRKDHVSGYGYDRRTTLALDHLMDESVTFENAFAASNWTVPSVATLMTGASPATHGVLTSADRLPEGMTTLAEALSGEGYVCGAFFGNAIMDIGGGFDRGFHRRFPRPKPFWCYRLRTSVERIVVRLLRGSYFEGRAVLGQAEAWIHANRSRPFFAYIHLMEPHSPYDPPRPYSTLFDPGYDGPAVRVPPLELVKADRGFRDWEAFDPGYAAIPERRRQNMVALYDGEIAFVDSLIERFLKRLGEWNVYDRTLILVTADHGEEFHEHGGWFHGQSLYDELVRVPLIVKLPGQVSAGTRREDPVIGTDLLSTILSAAGLPVPPGTEGVDVLTDDEVRPGERPLLPELPPFLYSVWNGRWKLIRKEVGGLSELKLFDMETDPGELEDVADRYPEVRDALAEMVAARVSETADLEMEPARIDLDSDQREKLRALGYIQ